MIGIEAKWNPMRERVVARASVPTTWEMLLTRQEAEQLIEELRVALIDSEEPLPEFSPVKA